MNVLVHFIMLNTVLTLQSDLLQKTLELEDFVWKNRIVLIFANSSSTEPLTNQINHLLEDRSGLLDRQLLVFSISKDEAVKEFVHGERFYADDELRRKYYKNGEGYHLVLIGKDGGVKYQTGSFLSREKLYGTIDAMPMRRAEMRRGGAESDRHVRRRKLRGRAFQAPADGTVRTAHAQRFGRGNKWSTLRRRSTRLFCAI